MISRKNFKICACQLGKKERKKDIFELSIVKIIKKNYPWFT